MSPFERLVAATAGRDGVEAPAGGGGFGARALTIDGRIFAMPNDAGLALKLPADRVAALIAAGDGLPFDAGKGRPMREWVIVPPRTDAEWVALAEEALAFVSAGRAR
jgi:hypothetical protein